MKKISMISLSLISLTLVLPIASMAQQYPQASNPTSRGQIQRETNPRTNPAYNNTTNGSYSGNNNNSTNYSNRNNNTNGGGNIGNADSRASISSDYEVNQELDRLYKQQQLQKQQNNNYDQVNSSPLAVSVNPSQQPNQQIEAPSTAAASNNGNGSLTQFQNQIYVQPQQAVVQKEATTVIEASPLLESKADKLRRARQDAEVQTEQKIAEKLEQSRMEDERRRSEAIFGDRYNQIYQGTVQQNNNYQNYPPPPSPLPPPGHNGPYPQQAPMGGYYPSPTNQPSLINNQPQQTIQQTQIASPVIITEKTIAPSPVIIVDENEKRPKDGHKGEHKEELVEKHLVKEIIDHKKEYFGFSAGLVEYPEARNVRGLYSLGVSFGQRTKKNLVVEGSFTYSTFEVEQMDGVYVGWEFYPRITDLDQYTGALAVKYQYFEGSFQPYVGGFTSYSYRTYSDKQFAIFNNEASSHSIDLGVNGGVVLELNEDFSVGVEMKYSWNLLYRTSNNGFQKSFSYSVMNSGTPIEEMNQLSYMLFGRTTF